MKKDFSVSLNIAQINVQINVQKVIFILILRLQKSLPTLRSIILWRF